MSKKKVITILCCVLVVIVTVTALAVSKAFADEGKTDAEKMQEMADRIEDAIQSVDDSYKKQIEVVTYPLTYQDAEGNTIIFTQCHTKYYDADPAKVTDLHTESIESVVALPDDYENCTVGEKIGAWFEKDDRAFLCWTISPQVSCVIEYSPSSVSKADIFKMAESVVTIENKE